MVPQKWKLSTISPVPKKGGRTLPENWRPINVLNVIAKVAEKHMRGLLERSIFPKLTPNQFGFMTGRSTEDAILFAEHTIRSYFYQRVQPAARAVR